MNDTTTEVKIDPEFLDWMRDLSITGDREALARRWQGLQALVGDFSTELLETSVKLVFRFKPAPSKSQLDEFKKHFIEKDELFDRGDIGRELELLAGAALDGLLKDDDWTADVGLAIQSASCLGQRELEMPLDLLGRATQRTIAFSKEQRKRVSKSVTALKVNFETAKKKLNAEQDWTTSTAAAFTSAAETVQSHLQQLAASATSAIKASEKAAALMDEELQILWWLIGAHSHTMNRPFSAIEERARVAVLTFELADMTVIAPGPASIEGILQRAGISSEGRCSIVSVINACDTQWLQERLPESLPSPAIAPLHFAIQRKLETGDDVSWVTPWSRLSGFKPEIEFDSTALALQFYKERVLIAFLGQS